PPEPVVSMELDSSPSKKVKEKESLKETPEITTISVWYASENFLNKNTASATITFAEDANFKGLKDCYSLFVLNNMVRIHMCDQSRSDILARFKFLAKLASLPRFTTGKQLEEIGRMIDAIA
ncbi:9359_t:CDS:2, partial [Funneliformis geosporum]